MHRTAGRLRLHTTQEEEETTMKTSMLLACLLAVAATPALAQRKACEELKTEIDQKMQTKGVQDFTLEIVTTEEVKPEQKVVGSCDGGTKKIVYKRGKE
jgi:hypothetical protein